MKLFGKILIILIVLILLGSATIWVLAKNINPDTIKHLVNSQMTTLTHKKSQINGDISWKIFPRPGLKFTKILIGDEKTKENYTLSIDALLLNLKITPLFSGQFVFSEINADGLKLEINSDIAQEKSSSEPSAKNNNEHSSDKKFAIENLVISHGQVIINKNGKTTVFKNLQASIEQFNLQNIPFPIQIKTKLSQAGSLSNAKANLNFQGRFNLSPTLLNDLQNGIMNSSIEGQLSLQNIVLNQFVIKNINTNLKSNIVGITFNPFTVSLYNGESIGDMNYSFANKQLSLNQTATNLDGNMLMTGLLGSELVGGNLDYSIHATIPLDKPLINAINGKGNITIKDGEIYHINLQQLISNLKGSLENVINGTATDLKSSLQLTDSDVNKPKEGSTPFKLANIQYQVQNGTMSSDALLLQTDKLQVNGTGSLNLTGLELNAKLKVSLNSNNTDNAMQKIQQILGGNFPFDVAGL